MSEAAEAGQKSADGAADEKDAELGGSMTLLEHLAELRIRLFYSALALLIGFFACMTIADQIFNFLIAPLADMWANQPDRRLIFTALHEKFFTDIKVAFFASACLTFPIIATQLWLFIAPGLYKNEKRAFLPFLLATPVLFAAGAACVYYGVMPVAWKFFAGFEQSAEQGHLAIMLEPKVNEYLSLVMHLIFAFGLAFQLPVLLTLLAKVGIIDSDWLKSKRRYSVVIAFIAAAVLTPPDPLSQIGLAVPIMLLYEISIITSRMVEKQREQAYAEADQASADPAGSSSSAS